jgi:hypothetical protein
MTTPILRWPPLASSGSRLDWLKKRSVIVPGWLIWISTRWPGLNPARSNHWPVSRILGDTLPRKKSPMASIFNVRVFIALKKRDTGALTGCPARNRIRKPKEGISFCARPSPHHHPGSPKSCRATHSNKQPHNGNRFIVVRIDTSGVSAR